MTTEKQQSTSTSSASTTQLGSEGFLSQDHLPTMSFSCIVASTLITRFQASMALFVDGRPNAYPSNQPFNDTAVSNATERKRIFYFIL
ncbi:hypothetical protein BpHYR1_009456 [Brachionus plicatilis]|uniref:Uncharacterized protein n=1 Tax=Brachionus plicatilis TaxID=10195 RepID=A0A3M7QDH2_BRAPC|nr:hypothetical protein BpHYR1_009456 [Brachionus plicatilis]